LANPKSPAGRQAVDGQGIASAEQMISIYSGACPEVKGPAALWSKMPACGGRPSASLRAVLWACWHAKQARLRKGDGAEKTGNVRPAV